MYFREISYYREGREMGSYYQEGREMGSYYQEGREMGPHSSIKHCHIIVSVPSQAQDFEHHTSLSFCIQLRWEVIVLYVVIGGIDDHHSLICLFIILLSSRSSPYTINVMCHRGLWHPFHTLHVSINHEGISPVSIKTLGATVNSVQNW
jgi:hypothetical protein